MLRSQVRLIAMTLFAAALLVVSEQRVQAQNTYADVPFNQGSLFYRPSGARPPRTTNTTTRRYLFRGTRPNVVTPPRTYYYAAPPQTFAAPAVPTAQPVYVYRPYR
jgi:hypothetical protein